MAEHRCDKFFEEERRGEECDFLFHVYVWEAAVSSLLLMILQMDLSFREFTVADETGEVHPEMKVLGLVWCCN